VTWPEEVPKTFNERDHKILYLKWVGMIEKVWEHIDPLEVEESSHQIKILGLPESEEEETVSILDVPLELSENDPE